MPKLQRRILYLTSVPLLAAFGFPVAPLSIPEVVEGSELIVVGPIVLANVRETTVSSGDSTAAAIEKTYHLTAQAVLKGQMPAGGTSISVRYVARRDLDPRYQLVPAPAYRICFLKRQGQEWTFTNSAYPTAPGAPPGRQPTADDPLDAVAGNLGSVLSTANGRNEKIEALAALRSIPKRKSVEAALLGDSSDPEPAIRLDVVGALLSLGNITHLNEAASALLRPDGSLPDYVLHNLRVGIYTGVHQPETIPLLADLLKSPDVATRRAAIMAIVRADTKAAIEPLKSSLDDPDQTVRFTCVLGLAKVTGERDWIPNMDMFRADEATYLSHWKDELR
jgi:hypothetical protein